MKKRYVIAVIGILMALMAAYIVRVSQRPAAYYIEQAKKLERDGEVKMAFLQWGNAESRSIKHTGEHTAELARIYIGLGDCSEDPKEVNGYYQQAMELYEGLGDLEGMADACRSMGSMYRMNGEPDRAKDYLEKARGYYEQYGETDPERLYWLNLEQGLVSDVYEREVDCFQKCEELLSFLPEELRKEANIRVYKNLSRVFYLEDQYGEALEYFQKLIEAYDMAGSEDYGGMANAYHYYGYTYALNGDSVQARKYIQEAINLCGKMKMDECYEELAAAYLHMAEVIAYLETPPDYETALDYGIKACQTYGDRRMLTNYDIEDYQKICEKLKKIYQEAYEDSEESFENWLRGKVTIKATSYQISFP